MTNYSAKEYGSNPNAGKNNNAGRAKWGGGWPNCSGAKAVAVSPSGARVTVRKPLVPLIETLFEITHLEGYKVRKSDTGGFNCRPIAGTRTPSNHSYGIAVDINWQSNPYSLRFKSDIPPAVVNAWETAGFYWGGRYRVRKDTMHFEYLGGPGDVKRDLAIAKKRLASLKGEPAPKPPAPSGDVYTVRAGDSLSMIAEAFGTTVAALVKLNGIKDPDVLAIGQKLKIKATPVPPKPTPAPSGGRKLGSRTLKRGSTGADVAVLQRFLGIKDDGIFGPNTETAVKDYQRLRHLKVDGIAGKKTYGPIVKVVYGK